MKPIELIKDFIRERLSGDIDKLATFSLTKLWNDDVYGCPNRQFDCDDTNLMRAVYCIVFKNAWNNLTMETLAKSILRGDTMNTRATLFGRKTKTEESNHPGIDKYSPSQELSDRVSDFYTVCNSIGNMMVLPNHSKKIELLENGKVKQTWWTINTHRGCCPEIQDYMDRFLIQMYKILTMTPDADENLMELVQANKDQFEMYYGEEGWKNYIRNNMLEYYCDEHFIPTLSSKGYTFWRNCYTSRDNYLKECERYLDFVTPIINERATRMIGIIKQQLLED